MKLIPGLKLMIKSEPWKFVFAVLNVLFPLAIGYWLWFCAELYKASRMPPARAEIAAFVARHSANALTWSRLEACAHKATMGCRGDPNCVADTIHICAGFRP